MSADEAKGFSSAQNDDKSQKRLKLYGILVFGIIGGTAISYAVGHARRTLEWVNLQMNRGMQWRFSTKQGKSSSSQNNQARYDGWKRYNQKIQAEMDEEVERVERIRRMQSVFNRERERYKRGYQSWHENSSDAFNQQNFQRDDWYWKTDRYSSQRAEEARKLRMRAHGGYTNAHHYEVLGLDTCREKPYSQDEIKAAFRNKAMKYHPDQNQNNKEAAEAKFKEVLDSYEVLKADNEKL